jgi:hypothetical protein
MYILRIVYSELQELKNSMSRDEKVAEVKAKLSAGVATEDLQVLNKAMAMAMELGCEGDADVQVCTDYYHYYYVCILFIHTYV